MRKIAVITGTRAEYGLLYWTIRGIHEDPGLELQLIVTGAHLSPEFGHTAVEIEKDGFPIAERVHMLLSSDEPEAAAASMGLATIGFAGAYARLRPDMLLVLGDRFETHAAVCAAAPMRLPVAHIHGGELTEGAMDELFRHSMTKMSHLHFAAARPFAARITQMGESPARVICVGAPGLENIRRLGLLKREALEAELGLPKGRPIGVVAYHPETLKGEKGASGLSELLGALDMFEEMFWVFTFPNADPGGRAVIEAVERYVKARPGGSAVFVSLGSLRFLSLIRHASVMAGNSSSGIIEAPSFGLPVVNVGERQKGRMRAKNVIDAPILKAAPIGAAIRKALSRDFRASLRGMKNPYGDGRASVKIIKALKGVKLEGLLHKPFNDMA